MTDFDIELVKKGRGVVTTGGAKVKILDTDRKVTGPIVAAVGTDEMLYVFTKEGKSIGGLLELKMAPQSEKRYFNIYTRYKDGSLLVGDCADTLEKSMQWATGAGSHLKFIRREIVEITL